MAPRASSTPDTRMQGRVRVHAGATRPVFTRLTIDDYDMIERLAYEKGTTVSTLMRSTIERMLDNKRRRDNG